MGEFQCIVVKKHRLTELVKTGVLEIFGFVGDWCRYVSTVNNNIVIVSDSGRVLYYASMRLFWLSLVFVSGKAILVMYFGVSIVLSKFFQYWWREVLFQTCEGTQSPGGCCR